MTHSRVSRGFVRLVARKGRGAALGRGLPYSRCLAPLWKTNSRAREEDGERVDAGEEDLLGKLRRLEHRRVDLPRCPLDPSLPRRSAPPSPPALIRSLSLTSSARKRERWAPEGEACREDSGGSAREGMRREGRGREESGREVREKEREEVASDFEGLLVKC